MNQEVGIISPAQAMAIVGPQSYDIKGSIRTFYNELTDLLQAYGDPNKDITIDGKLIKAKDKYGAYGTLLFNNKVNQLEQTQTTLVNVYSSLFSLEKSLTGTSS